MSQPRRSWDDSLVEEIDSLLDTDLLLRSSIRHLRLSPRKRPSTRERLNDIALSVLQRYTYRRCLGLRFTLLHLRLDLALSVSWLCRTGNTCLAHIIVL